jgi:hypothetical protein
MQDLHGGGVVESDTAVFLSDIQKLAVGFQCAERLGEDRDEPEGARYILLSDTCANDIAVLLYRIHGYLEYVEKREQMRLMLSGSVMSPPGVEDARVDA